jgi:hypothetical protein
MDGSNVAELFQQPTKLEDWLNFAEVILYKLFQHNREVRHMFFSHRTCKNNEMTTSRGSLIAES